MKSFPKYPAKPHKASGQARLRIKGRDYYLGRHSSPESRVAYSRLAREWATGTMPVKTGDKANVGEVVLAALRMVKAEKNPKEQAHYRRLLMAVLRVVGAGMLAESFDVRTLARVRSALVSGDWLDEAERKHSRAGGWCRNMVNAAMVRVRHVWRWAEAEGMVPRGSWEHLRTLRPIPKTDRGVRQTKPRAGVDWPDVAAVLPHLPAAVQAMAAIQWWTGMRPGEVVKMNANDIEEEDGLLVFWLESKNSWRPGREREGVIVGPEARKVLEPWLVAARGRAGEGWLFPTGRPSQGTHYTAAAYGRALCRAFEREPGLKKFSCYSLRHGFKRRVKRIMGLDAARAGMRQSSISTADRYDAVRDMDLAKDVARKTG